MTFLSDVIIWWRLQYFSAALLSFHVSLMPATNKQRLPSAAAPSHLFVHFAITCRQMVWVWVLPPLANIRYAFNLSHILMVDCVDRQLGRSVAVPLALCLLPYLFDLIQAMKKLAPSGPGKIKKSSKEFYDGWSQMRMLRLRSGKLSGGCMSDNKLYYITFQSLHFSLCLVLSWEI